MPFQQNIPQLGTTEMSWSTKPEDMLQNHRFLNMVGARIVIWMTTTLFGRDSTSVIINADDRHSISITLRASLIVAGIHTYSHQNRARYEQRRNQCVGCNVESVSGGVYQCLFFFQTFPQCLWFSNFRTFRRFLNCFFAGRTTSSFTIFPTKRSGTVRYKTLDCSEPCAVSHIAVRQSNWSNPFCPYNDGKIVCRRIPQIKPNCNPDKIDYLQPKWLATLGGNSIWCQIMARPVMEYALTSQISLLS